MPKESKYSIEVIQNPSGGKRAIGFLITTNDKKITGKDGFSGLSDKEKKWIQTAFDWWVHGFINKKRHHGWDKSEFNGQYTNCYVFKADNNRLYGYICNPKTDDLSFQFCVIVARAKKNQFHTEEKFLQIAEEYRNKILIYKAVKLIFPDKSTRKTNGKK